MTTNVLTQEPESFNDGSTILQHHQSETLIKPHCPNIALESVLSGVLIKSSYPQVRRVRCLVTPLKVTLLGNVPSFFLKQIAQETIRDYVDGRQINNACRVLD